MTELSYAAAIRALQERGRFGIRLGLGRTRALLRELGNPERTIRGALIAGTNGKGSVLTLAAAALQKAGYRTATTPKPHLVTYRERLQIDGRPIDPATFAGLVGEILPIAERVARRHGEPTEFELLTALLFRWFADEGVDLAVVEVGLGGRLDATHAWDGGVAVVTNVALDHMAQLGPTIRHIAREKAAIVERGDRAVTGADGEALAIVRRRAQLMGAPLTVVGAAPIVDMGRQGIVVELPWLRRTPVGLLGRHQAANVAVADATLDALEAAGIATVPSAARLDGYAAARWPGRLELLTIDGRDVLLDGAHNPAGAATLADALDDLRPYLHGAGGFGDGTAGDLRPVGAAAMTLVVGVMADKDVEGIVAALARSEALHGARIICTRVDSERAMPADRLAAVWEAIGGERTIIVEPSVSTAVERALSTADGPIVVAGSLYLVGAARELLVDDPILRDPPPSANDDPRRPMSAR